MPRTLLGTLAVYALQVALLIAAFVFEQYAANFFVCSLWVTLVVLKIRAGWSWCFPLFLALLCYITLQDPFLSFPWGLIPVTLLIFHVYLLLYVFYRPFRQSLDKGLSLEDLTIYMGHRVIGAYSFSKIIDESSPNAIAAHNPLEVMNANWVYSAGIVDFIVALAAPLATYLLFRSRLADGTPHSATRKPLLVLIGLINVLGFADFLAVGAVYSSLLLPGPFQMAEVSVSVIPISRFPVAVLVLGLAPVSMLFHIVSLHRIARHWHAADEPANNGV